MEINDAKYFVVSLTQFMFFRLLGKNQWRPPTQIMQTFQNKYISGVVFRLSLPLLLYPLSLAFKFSRPPF